MPGSQSPNNVVSEPHPEASDVVHSTDQIGLFGVGLREKRERQSEVCRFWLVISDAVAILGGQVAAFYLRFYLLPYIFPDSQSLLLGAYMPFSKYVPRIVFGGALVFVLLIVCHAYGEHVLLRYRRAFPQVIKAMLLWILALPFISLIFGFDENLSRIYIGISFFCLVVALLVTRFVTQRLLAYLGLTAAFRQRILFVDWTDNAAKLAAATAKDIWHPYDVVGCAPGPGNRFSHEPPLHIPTLGSYEEVSVLCEKGLVDIVILADGRRKEADVLALARECEEYMLDFMVVPTGFQILLSGLELKTVSSVPLLGVTKLPLDSPVNAALKRTVDIVGALFGLLVSIPLIGLFALLLYIESPGPIFYRQERMGRKGRKFHMIKIRSMIPDAPKFDNNKQSTELADPRLLKVGKIMRKLNVDEVPQFWNVLCGQMSLVGPRPERPYHVNQLKQKIKYYNLRHNIVPGMTGWAQVNGFRGDTDLNERIRCDIYYIEKWDLILDFQIMMMTLFHLKTNRN